MCNTKCNTKCNTNPMVLIYQDSEGERYFQNWEDLTQMGTLIDPETGDDMELIGWCEVPEIP